MSDFLHRVSTAGERPIVVSGEFSRMTQPLAEALSSVQGHWVIRTAGGGCYDARTGAPLDEPAAALALPPHPTRNGVHAAFTRAAVTTRLQVVATVSTRHQLTVRLGGVLEAASERFADRAPDAWGPTEPLRVAPWDRDDLTERTRRRMPLDSRWAAVTAGTVTSGTVTSDDHPVIATLHHARTAETVETTRVWADVAGPGDDRADGIGLAARKFLARAAGIGMPLLGVAFAALGSPDLARRSTATMQPEPLALLIGPPGVRAAGIDPRRWAGEFGAAVVGSPRLPGVLLHLGSPDGGGWRRLADVLGTLDAARVGALLSVAPSPRRCAPPGGPRRHARRREDMMPDQRDTVLIEQARIQRMRLGSALLYGRIDERRTVNDHSRRLVGSLILAAVACATCVGIAFVVQLLAGQQATAPSPYSASSPPLSATTSRDPLGKRREPVHPADRRRQHPSRRGRRLEQQAAGAVLPRLLDLLGETRGTVTAR